MTEGTKVGEEKNRNKDALSSGQSRLLGDTFYCQLVLLSVFFI